jgi:hypothetical protein
MPISISTDLYPLLIDLINQTYLDRVEQITAAQIYDSGDIIAVALDGQKKLAVKTTGKDIAIKLMSESAAFAGTVSKSPQKKKMCVRGISCGATCISASQVCKRELTPKQLEILSSLRQLAKGGSPVAQKQIDAIRVGQLNKTRLANEKAKIAAMGEVDKIVYESKKQMEETRRAAQRLQDEFSNYKNELTKLFGEDIPEPPSSLEIAKNALDDFILERQNKGLDDAKRAIDKALGNHIDDLSKETLSAADEALKKSLVEFLGEKEGQLEWDRMKLDNLVELDPNNRFDKPLGDGEEPPQPPAKKPRK